ncbi:MAG: DUF3696 domain-containing protein [Bacteroidales bacterium]|nr:DUF3696 domain-containing protein [Bacteroidales bacterium]
MNKLIINNFKCFTKIEIPLNRLTVMAGSNGNGKSTSIQALLLYRKTIEENYRQANGYYNTEKETVNAKVSLNEGYMLNLGNSSVISNRHIGGITISIGVHNDAKKMVVHYNADNQKPNLFVEIDDVYRLDESSMSILKNEFYYLNAERIGPRVNLPIQHYHFPNTGFQGENVAQMIAETNYQVEIEQERRHPKSGSPRLEQQLNAWLDDMMPGVRIVANQSTNTLTSQIQVENYFTKGDPTIATNLGFGISYVIPILATGLIAARGSYMVVENPEAHLHPSAQSKIGRFLSMVAQAGVNVIVETHSDHVINGIQISAAKGEISPDYATINFFSQDKESIQPRLESIKINEKGELSSWPKGFFDQTQIDFAELFKFRKK